MVGKEDVEPDVHTYIFQKQREDSFKDWPYDESCACNAKKMAEAGFFFSGSNKEPDIAQCYVCLKVLDGWEPEDNPWEEHKKHTSNCKFVEIGKAENEMCYNEFLDLYKERIKNTLKSKHEEFRKKLVAQAETSRKVIKKLHKTRK